ncbi:hypothetical protein LCGC14_2188850 [marine sediment metagenome]|uniref:Uncharacterized protein n=1 Tax=marine sediment metagenome TaxID=412755 RepID=A0A0F9FXI4_9ZZZZ
MGKLACGCTIGPGEPMDPETLKEHFKHTASAIFVWEILHRRGQPQGEDEMKLSQARIDLLEIIQKLYPEVKEGLL